MITRPLRVARLPRFRIIMGRIQGVVWAVLLLGLVGCQAPVNPRKKVSQEELLALAPDLVSTADDEATVGYLKRVNAAMDKFDSVLTSEIANLRPGDPLPPALAAGATPLLDEIAAATKPEWMPIRASRWVDVSFRASFLLRALAFGANSDDERIRANELHLLLARRASTATGNPFPRLQLPGQAIIDSLPTGGNLEPELRRYLELLPRPGEYLLDQEHGVRSEWTYTSSLIVADRPFPMRWDNELFGSSPEPYDRRKTAMLFINAIREDIAAAREGRVFGGPDLEGFPDSSDFGMLGYLGPGVLGSVSNRSEGEHQSAKEVKAWAKRFPSNPAGEHLFREFYWPKSRLALEQEALAAVLRGSFATMIMMNRGQRPESWEDVVKAGLLEEVPLDPYSKKPLEADFVKGRIRCQSVKISGKKLTNPLNEAVVQIPHWLLRIL